MCEHDELPHWQECMTSQISEWMCENYGGTCMGALTGTDWKAMRAIVALLELHAYAPEPTHWQAFAILVETMQEKTRWMAHAIIAMVLNWDDRNRLWMRAKLPPFTNPLPRAKHDDTPEVKS